MSGELAQLIKLMGAYDSGTEPDATGFPFEFVEWVRYELRTSAGSEPADVNHTVQEWFAGLRARGVGRLLLAVPGVNTDGLLPDRRLFGFVNSVGWFLVGAGPQGERWRAFWKVGNQQAADRRIWQILVEGMAATGPLDPTGVPLLAQPPAVADATAELLASLRDIHEFSVRAGLQPWPGAFRRAIEIGTAEPEPPPAAAAYQKNLLPAGWQSPEARRLIRTAYASAVFGGMGTWNDIGSSTHQEAVEYDRLSDRLFKTMLGGFVAGANA